MTQLPNNELCDYYLHHYPVKGDNYTVDDVAEDAKALAQEVRRLTEERGRLLRLCAHAEQLLSPMQAEVERLRAIVDELPKDAEGNPLEPNTSYWFKWHGDLMRGVYTISAIDVNEPRGHASDFAPNVPGAYHKTREAAEAKGDAT